MGTPMDPTNGNGSGAMGPDDDLLRPGTTGRYLVLLRQDAVEAGIHAMTDVAGMHIAHATDGEGDAGSTESLSSGDAIVFDQLSVAVVNAPPDQLGALRAADTETSGILAIEPERVVYAIDVEPDVATTDSLTVTTPMLPISAPVLPAGITGRLPVEYLMGYRDAVNHLVDQLLATDVPAASSANGATIIQAPIDESLVTWGLQLTKVPESQFTGKGVRIAVLDTGFDLEHPDFMGRHIVSKSFIPNEDVQDGHGHGTHCIGTACGPKQPGQLPRYGVAYESDIYVGKVLSNRGSGSDGGILAGIQWAIANKCKVISMSLGAAAVPGQAFSRVFEAVARRALAAGTLIIAAAGNESQRPVLISPVSHPANCPSIMSVAAFDSDLNVARFSCGGINPQGGQVDIAGPGVNVHSSWPRPLLYRRINGTSMATPHVAGIAALHAEANPDVVGGALGWLLLQSAQRFEAPARDGGAGLVQAP